jgi:mannose-1-phosphate guanylyltransferase/phosphomannomutase
MHGSTSDIFPNILNDLDVENVVLNAYNDKKKLFNIESLKKRSESNISTIVKSLKCSLGVIIYPNAQRLKLVTDEGEVLDKVRGLLSVLYLLNMTPSKEKKRVFLPTWAPDIIKYENLDIEHGNYSHFKAKKLSDYTLIATIDGNYTFTEFSITRDAMYASVKIMELAGCNGVKLSDISKSIENFYYKRVKIPCTQALKGKMMRKFLEESKGKKSSSIDGVKIWENDTNWILMIPDSFNDHLNIYIQAADEAAGVAMLDSYTQKILTWSKK